MKEKVVRVTIVNVGFWISLFSLAVSMFSLGLAVAKVVTEVKEEMAIEEVAIVEEVAKDIYSEDVPLSEEDQRALYAASEEFGVDYYVMLGLIERETDFRNISGDGGNASGYCQVWKYWWGDLMTDIGAEDLNVPKDNFRTACAIVSELTEEHGSVAGALTAYNKGSYDGTVSQYATSVLENAEKWRA